MRFHGLVLAAMLGRPFVGIVHDNKISEICRRFGMPYHDVSLDGADLAANAEDIREKVPDKQLLDESRRAGAKENFSCPCVARDNVSRRSIWRNIGVATCVVRACVASRNDR